MEGGLVLMTSPLAGPKTLPVLGVDELDDLDDQALAKLCIDKLARSFSELFRSPGPLLTISPLVFYYPVILAGVLIARSVRAR
jgi:hypothetical protein